MDFILKSHTIDNEEWDYFEGGLGGAKKLLIIPGFDNSLLGERLQNQISGGSPAKVKVLGNALPAIPSLRDELGKAFHIFELGRPRVLAKGTTTARMADGYAKFMQAVTGECCVAGFSMGGMIGQHLALQHPGLVSKLVLVVSGQELAGDGRHWGQQWRSHASAEDWAGLLQSIAHTVYHTYVGKLLGETMAQFIPAMLNATALDTSGKLFNPRDPVISIEAWLNHNTSAVLSQITTPTHVIAAEHDKLFSRSIVMKTARALRDRNPFFLEGVGHAFPETRIAFDQAVHEIEAFLL